MLCVNKVKKGFHTGIVKKSVIIYASEGKVWKKIGNIIGLPSWVKDVKQTVYASKIKNGVGAIRKITFNDNSTIEEHVVAWKPREHFTYIATEGLPLRAYVATISMEKKSNNKIKITWKSYINSKKMTKAKFMEFLNFMELFYAESLNNLKLSLEKKDR